MASALERRGEEGPHAILDDLDADEARAQEILDAEIGREEAE